MPDITLYLGYRNYSSWSLRAWLALERTGAPFEEHVFNLADPRERERLRRHSPTGKVPVLEHGDRLIWDSLAIGEYLAETFPAARLWPGDPAARATARAVSAEMHSGFFALREHMPMNLRRSSPGKGRAEGVGSDIDRITELWRDCRERFGAGGQFLFGECGLADFMYAPVVTRFATYAVDVDPVCRAYMEAVESLPAMRQWRAAAETEPWSNPRYDL